MKKSITSAVVLLAGAYGAWSQGTVSMGNYLDLSPPIYASYGYPGFSVRLGGTSGNATGNPLADVGKGNDFTVALYGNVGVNDAASTLTECTVAGGGFATATFADGVSDKVAGTWATSIIAQIPGTTTAGQTATLQLYLWYNDGGTITSYRAAAVIGQSALANLPSTGGINPAGGPPILPPSLPGFGNFGIERLSLPPGPEPSTLVLGIVGGCGILLRQRFGKRN
jgi:hypothetical protein